MPIAARVAGVLVTLMVGTTALAAQDFPSCPIKMIVPYPAGGITDKDRCAQGAALISRSRENSPHEQ
jgi:tripartite-type tricarboxylate transporter receptor subunit TctC